jgi:hypothetical protein
MRVNSNLFPHAFLQAQQALMAAQQAAAAASPSLLMLFS